MKRLVHIDGSNVLASAIIIASSLIGILIPLVLKQAIDQQSGFANGTGIALLGLFLFQAVLVTAGDYLMARSGEHQVNAIRQRLMNHLLYTPKTFLDRQKSGDLASHIMNDTNIIRTFFTTNVASFLAGVVTIIGSLIALFLLDWRLSLVLIFCFPLILLVTIPISSLSERFSKQLQEDTGETTGLVSELFRKISLIKASAAESTTAEVTNRKFAALYKVALKTDLIEAVASPLVLLFLFGSVAVVFAYGGQRVAAGTLTVGTLMSFLIYLFQLLNPIGGLSSFFASLAKMKGATKQIQALLATTQEILDVGSTPPTGDLLLSNVTFGYGNTIVLDNITMEFKEHKKTAIVGPSGGGKTTIVGLIERFYQPQSGNIKLGNQLVSDISLRRWRENIAVVDQNNDVMSGTIRENLLFGVKQDYSQNQIYQVLNDVGLFKDVTEMPQGLETYVGEDGGLLSGGQRQRLQIARAYLRDPNFIIFDEATANLDADTEFQVTSSLNKLLTNKTAILIAHRLSTITDADEIYFLENHHITGRGTHQELMASHEAYRRFVEEQIIQ